ncbi:hypothetical protein McanMca71_005310 [Microsporum canis]|uniref:BZIP domain-containing protein n=1 Tax=Arthroderma otae (strain ATCC MYA-4605 / CBS 113480) TaxID=554155 RepID=C5FBE0_ARTOC|nr:conserved hypothetical protein [Microsporum canis CBS 113480]EEQ27124.1 conserved hypothetical protein [Microsporum canis CBS 113480]
MAAMGELPMPSSALSPLSSQQSFDVPVDMDSFINLEPTMYPSPSVSPSGSDGKASNKHGFVQQQQQQQQQQQMPALSTTASSPQQPHYKAPSHQYNSYTQQTGLPPGGLANTMALNNFGFDPVGMVHPVDGLYGRMGQPLHSLPALPLKDSTEMDIDESFADSEAYIMPSQATKAQFVDPSALGGQEMPHSAPTNQARRVYPGIHQQQAARAKAALQQRQEMLQRQQQQQQQQQQQPPQQRQAAVEGNQQGIKPQAKLNRNTDPAVQERISRLLQQMRQNSVTSQDNTEQSCTLPQPTKYKKDEQDMDEDERLLASEEGKKLSSKERRQLRNKVSARAFRSRRKEYIGQLEGEVAAKTNEANELRLRNDALTQENARLTDFTRMLLSSSHFAPFLDELSTNGLPPNLGAQPQTQAPALQLASQPTVTKQEGIEHLTQDVSVPNLQTGLPAIPEQGFDFASIDLNDQGWNSGIDFNFTNPSVFAVLDVPVPSPDTGFIIGKSSNRVGPLPSDEAKDAIPSIDAVPFGVRVTEAPTEEVSTSIAPADLDIDVNDPSFALFLDQPPTSTPQPSSDDVFTGTRPANISSKLDLVVEGSTPDSTSNDVSPTAKREFERLCSSIEASFCYISQLTAHLD